MILGNVALQERRVTDADLLYQKATELLKSFTSSPKRKEILEPQTISGLAAVAEAREQWALAQTDLESLLKLNPKDAFCDAAARPRVVPAEGRGRRSDEAQGSQDRRQGQRAHARGRAGPFSTSSMATTFNAQKWMTKALNNAPDDLRTQLVLAQWALETGQIDMAETHAAKALTLDPKSLEAKVLRGVVALFKKDYKVAEKVLRRTPTCNRPAASRRAINLALALCEQVDSSKKPDAAKLRRALEYANANYQQNSKNADAASTLGWGALQGWRPGSGRVGAPARPASTGNLSADTAYYMAQISYDRGRKDDAKILLEAVLKGTRPFSMRPEAGLLLDKLKSEPAPKKEATK